MTGLPTATGFQARALLIAQDTGSYCDRENVQALNLAIRDAGDEEDALRSLHDCIADCAHRLRVDGLDIAADAECSFDLDEAHQWIAAGKRLEALKAEVADAIRVQIDGRLSSSTWETTAGEVVAARMAMAA